MEGSSYAKKEEFIETDHLIKIIKKEEDIPTKVEDFTINNRNYNQMNTLSELTIPFIIKTEPTMPCPSYDLNIYPMNSVNYGQIWKNQQSFLSIIGIPQAHLVPTFELDTSSIPLIKVEPSQERMDIINQKKTTNKKKKEIKKNNKVSRVSGSRNYIGLVSTGLSRVIGAAEEGSKVLKHLEELFHKRKINYDSLHNYSEDELVDSFLKHVFNTTRGRKVKRTNKDREFKFRNSEELDKILTIHKSDDDDYVCLRKEVLREMVEYFFDSECYFNWVTKGSMNEASRIFLVDNREEIKKKFLNPLTYKPKFIYQ